MVKERPLNIHEHRERNIRLVPLAGSAPAATKQCNPDLAFFVQRFAYRNPAHRSWRADLGAGFTHARRNFNSDTGHEGEV